MLHSFQRFSALAVAMALLLSATLLGQSDLSTIRGTATDSAAAIIANADIKLVETETNFTRSVMTDDVGNYEIPYLRRGTYRLTASRAGFATFVADNIILESNQT